MKIEKESKVEKTVKTEPEDLAYAKKLAQLKEQYRRIYETNIAGERILWRPLKRSEYKDMLNMEFPEGTSEEDKTYDRETFIAKCVVLYPEEVVEDIALVAEIITSLCMEKSGFIERNNYDCKEV